MASTSTVYAGIEGLIAALRETGLNSLAGTLHHRMHGVAWTSSTELMEELRDILNRELASSTELPQGIRTQITASLEDIDALV